MGIDYRNSIVGKVRKKDFLNSLINDLITFDADIDGSNGTDYLEKKQVSKECSSYNEYIGKRAVELHGETEEAIRYMIDNTIGTDGYYYGIYYDITEMKHYYKIELDYVLSESC